MFCNKCGNEINENAKFCTNCGNNIKRSTYNYNNFKVIGAFICICGVMLLFIGIIINNNQNKSYYFKEETSTPEITGTKTEGTIVKKGRYTTVIIYDNKYSGQKITNKKYRS